MARSKAFNCTYTRLSDFIGKREDFKYNCPHRYKSQAYTVAIDWLQINVDLSITPDLLGTDFTKGRYRFVCQPSGTKDYVFRYFVYVANEHVFTVLAHARNSKSPTKSALVKFENHLLYGDWFTTYTDMKQAFCEAVNSISRLDIAFDGMNHIHKLLCDWLKDKNSKYHVKMIGKSNVTAHEINRTTKAPKGWTIGKRGGLKQIAVYDKTAEIYRNWDKKYIMDYWVANDLYKPVEGVPCPTFYRFEVRLHNGWLKHTRGEDLNEYDADQFINALQSHQFLVSVANLAMNGFFEWIYMDDKNVSRCTRVQLLPTPVKDFVKVTHSPAGTVYKAKMTLHNTYMQLCANIVGIDEGIAIMQAQIKTYSLKEWYRSRMRDFSKKYRAELPQVQSALYALAGGELLTDKVVRNRMHEITAIRHNKQKALKL